MINEELVDMAEWWVETMHGPTVTADNMRRDIQVLINALVEDTHMNVDNELEVGLRSGTSGL